MSYKQYECGCVEDANKVNWHCERHSWDDKGALTNSSENGSERHGIQFTVVEDIFSLFSKETK